MSNPHTPLPWAWARKWAVDGIDVMKLPKKDRPRGWELHNVTKVKIVADDVPLYLEQPVNSHAVLVEALREIAAFDDTGANEHLAKTGSYGAFDEPGAVETARAALAQLDKPE